ncbi:MAG TPA: type II CAAX endopeptidase family protein [Flavitalea sp.]|nr:type II CAAX endopeptidase family protein [Flavitalea sp.]
MRNPLSAYHEMRQNKSAYLFCLLVFPYTWFFWGTAIFSLQSFNSFSGKLLLFTGLIGPLVVTLFLVRNIDLNRKEKLLQQVYDYKRINTPGYLLLILLPLAITSFSILLSTLFGYSLLQFVPDPKVTFSVLSFSIFLVSTFLIGPLPEEIGWRGYLLDAWLHKYTPLKASLLVGLVWMAWQVPLFFILDHPLQRDGANPLFIPIYLLTIFPKSILFTWFYLRFNRSILAAILLHFSINVVVLIVQVEVITAFYELLLWTIAAAIIVKKDWFGIPAQKAPLLN